MDLNRITGGKACYHQLSGSGTIWASMVVSTISHYKVLSKLDISVRGQAARAIIPQIW